MGQFQKPPYREGGMLSSIPPAVLLPEGGCFGWSSNSILYHEAKGHTQGMADW